MTTAVYSDAVTHAGRLLGISDPASDPEIVDAIEATQVTVDGVTTYTPELAAAAYLERIIVRAEIAAVSGTVSSFTSEGSSFTVSTDLAALRRRVARLRRSVTGGFGVIDLVDARQDEPPRSTYPAAPQW